MNQNLKALIALYLVFNCVLFPFGAMAQSGNVQKLEEQVAALERAIIIETNNLRTGASINYNSVADLQIRLRYAKYDLEVAKKGGSCRDLANQHSLRYFP